MEINGLPINAAPSSGLYIELSDGNRATLASLPAPDAVATLLAGKETAGAAATVQGNLNTHTADTAAHGATASNTASRIVMRNAGGTFTVSGIQLDTAAAPTSATGLIRWNDVDKTGEIVTEGGVVLQLGQEETVYVRNNSGVALVEGDAVYITGSSGQRTTVAKVQANSAIAQKTIGLVTTTGGIANNAFGFVTLAGLVRDINTVAYAEGTELWLSPTTAGALTATVPTSDTSRVVRIGYVVRSHATQGMIMVATHYHGTVLSNALMEAEGAAAGRTALGVVAATESVSGIVELATLAEVATGTDTTRAVTPAGVRSALVSRFFDGYLQSDGATANRAQIYGQFDAVNNPREYVAGAATLTEAGIIPVPTASSTAEIVGRSSSLSALASATANSMGIAWSGNDLVIRCNGATPATDFRTVTFTGLRTTYSGQTIFGKAVFTNGATAPTFAVNGGSAITGTATNGGGTTPDWLSASLVPTYREVGYNCPSGPAPIVTPILGTTSAADDAFYLSTGKWPAWVVAGGTTTKFNTAAFTVGSGTGSFSANTSTSLVCAGATASLNVYSNASQVLIAGQKIRANLTVSGVTGSQVYFTTDSLGSGSGGSFGSLIAVLANGTADYDITVTASGTFFGRFVFTSTTAASITINSIDRIGALSLTAIQPINVMDDVSGIGGNQGRLLGMTPVTDKTDWRISANTWTNGNQRILAGNVLDSTKDVIDLVEQSTTGTPTTTIGSVSAGAGYKASSALTAGINPVTLVTRKLASNDVWVNSNSTAVVRTTIKGHRTA